VTDKLLWSKDGRLFLSRVADRYHVVKVILDMDPGIDDALAIMLAVNSPELEILGITTVSGNVHVDKTSINALRVLNLLGAQGISVYQGAGKPLVRELTTAEWVHGEDGLGDAGIPMPGRQALNGAVSFLAETLESERDVTLVTTGPLTNVALALTLYPQLAHHIRRMILMGGAYGLTQYGYGNTTPVSEFNIYVDPEAAKIVFESGVRPLCVGLDITTDPTTTLKKRDWERLANSSSATARAASKIIEKFVARFGFMQLHDPMAVAAAINPSLFRSDMYHVYVVCEGEMTRGQTVIERRFWVKKEPNAEVCHGVNRTGFLKLFFDRIGVLDD
jgi:inosine-uridine nucleoside N-ribohydrolase